jgi:heme/copper-type cytochrome/quinol oxidase subunit 2
MRAIVIVDNEENYDNWLNEQETFSSLIAKQNDEKLKTTIIAKNDN